MKETSVFLLFVSVNFSYAWRNTLPSSGSVDAYNCTANSSPTVNTSCVVDYKSSLALHCPNVSHSLRHSFRAEWWKIVPGSGKDDSICQSGDCVVPGPLHNQDSGVYYCESLSGGQKYYVNVTVLAPPSIVCYLCHCNEVGHECTQTLVSVTDGQHISLMVKFNGLGPISVMWTHGSRILDCFNARQCTITRGINDTYQYEILTIPPDVADANGTYRAYISNPYGYNVTTIDVEIKCEAIEPPAPTPNHSVNMTIGQTQNITLRSKGDRHNNLWLCFTTDKYVTIWNISLNSSCTECFLRSVDCPELRNRPHWNVSRNQVLNCSSNYLLELTVVVTNARKEDSGRFMLTWSSDSSDTGPKNHPVLTVTSLNVTSSDSNNDRGLSREYIYIYSGVGGVGVGLLVVVCVVVTVAVRCKVRRQPVRRDHRRRRHYAHAGGGGGLCVGGRPPTDDTTTDTSSDDEQNHERRPLRGAAAGARGYGGINPDTSELEPEGEVVLQSPSEDDFRRI